MNFKVIIVLILFLTSLGGDTPLSWKSNYKLTWQDFQGPTKENYGAVAVTASGITFSYSVQRNNDRIIGFKTVVEAHFYPKNSWYVKEKTNEYILAHEQLHFDITELHVRKLRQKISVLPVSQNIKEQLSALHLSAQKELYEMQNLYDFESENSIDKENQIKWFNYIAEELRKYEQFSSI